MVEGLRGDAIARRVREEAGGASLDERARLTEGLGLILRGLALAGPKVTWVWFRGRPIVAHPDHPPLMLCEDGATRRVVPEAPS